MRLVVDLRGCAAPPYHTVILSDSEGSPHTLFLPSPLGEGGNRL